MKVCQKPRVSHINSTSWFICSHLSIVMSKADRPLKYQCFNESFNYIIDTVIWSGAWWELGSAEQSNPIKAITGPPIAELGARACWDDLIENVFEGFVQSWGSYVDECVLYSWSLQFIDKQRQNSLTSLGSVARFPLLTSSSRMKRNDAARPLETIIPSFRAANWAHTLKSSHWILLMI